MRIPVQTPRVFSESNYAIIPAFAETDKSLSEGAYLRQLLTSKNGKVAKRVQMINGNVWRPQLDEAGRSFVARKLKDETGENFTGIVALTMNPDPRGIGLLNDEFEAHIV